jgi:hypothetical protein
MASSSPKAPKATSHVLEKRKNQALSPTIDAPKAKILNDKSLPSVHLVEGGGDGWSRVVADDEARDLYKASEVDWTLLRHGGRRIHEVARGCGIHHRASLTPKSALFNTKSSTFISTPMVGHLDKVVWNDMMKWVKEAQEVASHSDSVTESERDTQRQSQPKTILINTTGQQQTKPGLGEGDMEKFRVLMLDMLKERGASEEETQWIAQGFGYDTWDEMIACYQL